MSFGSSVWGSYNSIPRLAFERLSKAITDMGRFGNYGDVIDSEVKVEKLSRLIDLQVAKLEN